jgi:hypothetical protein
MIVLYIEMRLYMILLEVIEKEIFCRFIIDEKSLYHIVGDRLISCKDTTRHEIIWVGLARPKGGPGLGLKFRPIEPPARPA